MKDRLISGSLPLLLFAVVFTLLSVVAGTHAQNSRDKPTVDPLSGKFEGMVKSTPAVDSRLTLEITNERGHLSGRFITPQGATEISGGSFSKGKLTLKLGSGQRASKIKALLQNDILTGEWIDGKNKRAIELQKVPVVIVAVAPAGVPPASPPEPVPAEPTPAVADASVSVAGDWDAVADAQGQGLPFTLSLRVDGEKVSGESSSSLGSGTISNGTWKDGKLVFQLDTPSGAVAMSAVVKDGGLVGEFDFAGQIQGRWVAKRRTQ